jgi:hypothetical protein
MKEEIEKLFLYKKEISKIEKKIEKTIAAIYRMISKVLGETVHVETIHNDDDSLMFDKRFVEIDAYFDRNYYDKITRIPEKENSNWFDFLSCFPTRWLWEDFEKEFKTKYFKVQEDEKVKSEAMEESIISTALKKLTPEERKALRLT